MRKTIKRNIAIVLVGIALLSAIPAKAAEWSAPSFTIGKWTITLFWNWDRWNTGPGVDVKW